MAVVRVATAIEAPRQAAFDAAPDIMGFDAPLGVLGRIAEALFLASYMRRLLMRRAAEIKRAAENAGG